MAADLILPYTHKLAHPISWGAETLTEATFKRRLQAKDFKGVPAGGELKFDHMMLILARVTGMSQSQVEELDAADLQALSEVVNGFLSAGQGTGAT